MLGLDASRAFDGSARPQRRVRHMSFYREESTPTWSKTCRSKHTATRDAASCRPGNLRLRKLPSGACASNFDLRLAEEARARNSRDCTPRANKDAGLRTGNRTLRAQALQSSAAVSTCHASSFMPTAEGMMLCSDAFARLHVSRHFSYSEKAAGLLSRLTLCAVARKCSPCSQPSRPLPWSCKRDHAWQYLSVCLPSPRVRTSTCQPGLLAALALALAFGLPAAGFFIAGFGSSGSSAASASRTLASALA